MAVFPRPGNQSFAPFFAFIAKTLQGAPENLAGAGAVSPSTPTSYITSTGVGTAFTLADGLYVGQRKRIVHEVDGGTAVLTPAHPEHFATLTFNAVHDFAELEWTGTAWRLVAYIGLTIA